MSRATQYLILNHTDYFADAEMYIEYHQRFKTDTFYETFGLFMKLVGNLLLAFLWKSSAMSLAFTLYRTVEDWKEFLCYKSLQSHVQQWREIVQSVGGPFIVTNDEMYQPYVYADGMQRIYTRLFGLSKERTKRL